MAEQRRTTRTPKSKAPQPVNDYGRIQPQAPELEEAVLGALMIEKDAYSLVSEILRPESFYEHRHQLIYSAITDLAVNQKPVDILTVKEQLAKRGDLEEVGGPFYITQLSSKVASSAHIEYHARIIAQKALARELITFTSNIQSKAFDETLDDEIRVTVIATGFDKAPGALDFNKDKKPAEQSGESAAAGLAPLDFDKEKAEEEAKHEDEPDPFDDIFKIFNRER